MRELMIISPCFYPTSDPAELMVRSARKQGLTVWLYGINQPFLPHGADAQVKKLHDFMSEGQKARYALITDCRDVLFLAGETEIVEKFQAAGSPLVMSTERGCWPPEPELVTAFYGKDKNGYDYINAGQYIGEWEHVTQCLQHLLETYRGKHDGADNSQGWWMHAKLRGELEFSLDSGCEIFQTMSGGADAHVATVMDDRHPGRLTNWITESQPCSIHYNGNPGNDLPQKEMYDRFFT